MTKDPNLFKKRLIRRNKEKIEAAQYALYVGMGYLIFLGFFAMLSSSIPALIDVIVTCGILVGIRVYSNSNPKTAFQIGVGLCAILAILNLINMKLIAAVVFGITAAKLYEGIVGAKFLEENENNSKLENDKNILDANMWNED